MCFDEASGHAEGVHMAKNWGLPLTKASKQLNPTIVNVSLEAGPSSAEPQIEPQPWQTP